MAVAVVCPRDMADGTGKSLPTARVRRPHAAMDAPTICLPPLPCQSGESAASTAKVPGIAGPHFRRCSFQFLQPLLDLPVHVHSLLASFEYYRFVRLSRLGRTYMPRTAMLAVVVGVILAILGVVMASYLVVVSL